MCIDKKNVCQMIMYCLTLILVQGSLWMAVPAFSATSITSSDTAISSSDTAITSSDTALSSSDTTIKTAGEGRVVTDSRGEHTLPGIPVRPAVLDWNLFEQVVELGVKPLTITDAPAYREWVVKPAIPPGTQNVGTRGEPNLEKIAALHPDLILITETQQDLIPRLTQIAPVLLYTNFRATDKQAEVAIREFQQLAQVFGKTQVAREKLKQMTQRFTELKQQLQASFGTPLPEAVVMRFADTTSTFLYTRDSMADYVLHQLGLKPGFSAPPAKWGIVRRPITTLKNIREGYVLYLLPLYEEKKLQRSVLWQAMPFVRHHRVNSVAPVWTYGGAMSLRYMAEAITQSLLEVAPAS
ncbi:Iron(3+)-hydroxamate-binding protein FhuD precursor [Vibrio aerogenes CECT 7868]|uniref:Iron(3+)-hydroxamate-binding protein FhuD n=1 Tax=Vibrio aerogenes CECT 7868 TaxID=1216006 RepID=A0A1M5ZNK7_9VIBR|nr:iron-siderophore ABC transporter substrate-binding protein [Vibrio aerogenes]SHI25782.1 Iron(3+)-hydroxamate-binding protein FhuD precursor [Vibrio aerogenes CECT 7868]